MRCDLDWTRGRAVTEVELGDQLVQGCRFLGEAVACRCRLLDHGGILLGALVHGVDGGVDFLNADGLFAGGFHDGVNVLVDLLDFGDDVFQRLARVADEFHTGSDLITGGDDQRLDFLCSRCRTLGQFTHFLCDNRKALTGFTGARSFDTGIQSQQVGLEGDFVDDADDVRNLAGGFFDLLHRNDGIANDLAGMFGAEAGLGNETADFFGTLGRVTHSRCDFFQRCCGFFDRSGLLLGTLGQVVSGRADFVGASVDTTGIFAHRNQRFIQLADGVVEVVSQAVEVIHERRGDAVSDVAICQLAKALRQCIDGELNVGGFLGFLKLALLTFLFGHGAVGIGFAFHLDFGDGIVLEDLHGFGHLADFVLTANAGNVHLRFAAGQTLHSGGHGKQWAGNAGTDQQTGSDGNDDCACKAAPDHVDRRCNSRIICSGAFCQ